MNKYDLKAGYLIEFRNGLKGVVVRRWNDDLAIMCIDDCVYDLDSDFGKDMTFDFGRHGDIMKIYSQPDGVSDCMLSKMFNPFVRKLLWERNEIKKMTLQDIRDQLGYDFELVED